MTDEELWAAIHAHNRRQKDREQKLANLRGLLPPPGKILSIKEFVELLKKIREILEEAE